MSLTLQSSFGVAHAVRKIGGSRGSPLGDPLSLAGRGPCRFSSSAMPTLPRQDPSDGNSAETHGESEKFTSSTCVVEMLADGGLPLLWSWQRYAAKRVTPSLTCMSSRCRAGDIRSRPQAGGAGRANSASLYRMAPVWPHGDKQVTVLGTLTAPARVSGQNSIRCRRHHV